MPDPPLAGVRVLDLSRLLPGPYCTLILADLGADVVKVEDVRGGDYLRHFPPQRDGLGGAYYALNRGKRSLALDLKHAAGRDLLLRLLPAFDVVVESFRPGVLQRLGLDYPELAATHPSVILCSITGYGQNGPLRDRAGHDINYQALGGLLAASGAPDGPPAMPGVQVADIAGGALWATIRILAALRSGEGAHLDVSMTEGAMSLLLPWFGDFAFGGAPLRRGAHLLAGGAARYGVYPAADERCLAVGALEPKFFDALAEAVDRQTGSETAVADTRDEPQIRERLAQALASAPRDTWAQTLAAADACVEPVLEMNELPEHPQHRARGAFAVADDPTRGSPSLMQLPLDQHHARSPAPRLGEHTEELLADAGLTSSEIQQLRAARTIGG